ncbi:hypothetical protein BU14_0052s0018, partial [Porphyra umbilicalis]
RPRARRVRAGVGAPPPPGTRKPHWRTYVYVHIGWAVWEETGAADAAAAATVLTALIRRLPRKVTFTKLYRLAAGVHLRARAVPAARRILGAGLGAAPTKASLYAYYIRTELLLGNVGRGAKLADAWAARAPAAVAAYT